MGMLSCKDVISNITLSGNMYDDWYIGRKSGGKEMKTAILIALVVFIIGGIVFMNIRDKRKK